MKGPPPLRKRDRGLKADVSRLELPDLRFIRLRERFAWLCCLLRAAAGPGLRGRWSVAAADGAVVYKFRGTNGSGTPGRRAQSAAPVSGSECAGAARRKKGGSDIPAHASRIRLDVSTPRAFMRCDTGRELDSDQLPNLGNGAAHGSRQPRRGGVENEATHRQTPNDADPLAGTQTSIVFSTGAISWMISPGYSTRRSAYSSHIRFEDRALNQRRRYCPPSTASKTALCHRSCARRNRLSGARICRYCSVKIVCLTCRQSAAS